MSSIPASSVPALKPIHKFWYALPLLVAVGLVSILYRSAFAWWWEEWTSPGSFYAHAIFVPFFVGVMIWRNREKFRSVAWRPSWTGLWPFGLAMLLLLIGQRLDVTAVQSLSFMLLLFGVVLLILGKKYTGILLFPLLFIVMMMPLLPDQLINIIAFPIQMRSASLATFLLNLMTLHSVQHGTLIQMDNYQMAVELPCSGFKTLISLITFTAAFAYLVEGKLWKRWTLFLTTIPLSLFINALRITLIGVVGDLISRQAAATFHDYSGFIVLTLAFLFLFNFARMLRCERFLGIPLTEEQERRDREAEKAAADASETARANAPGWLALGIQGVRNLLGWRPTREQLGRVLPFALVINLALLAALGAQGVVTRGLHPEPPIATTQVPLTFSKDGVTWQNVTLQVDPVAHTAQVVYKTDPDRDRLPKEAQDALSPSRVINRDYAGSDGSILHLFITAGNGRKTFHDPHACSMGADARLTDQELVDIPSSQGTLRVLETYYQKADQPYEYIMMYCYVIENKQVVHSKEDMRNAIIRQMVFGDAGKPSYFIRIMHLSAGVDHNKREQTQRFISALWEQIEPVIMGRVKGLPEPEPQPLPETKP
ncbi:MAG TPA: exosortase/archaeosortase family protein [Chthonomonadaceae bacterium]|nr:exosortase/archaeosortase family protein [Chthonomonadaceae bacterium]